MSSEEDDEETTVQKLKDHFGTSSMSPSILEFTHRDDVKTAFEMIDGVDEIRANLELAQFGDGTDENPGGSLNKAIAKANHPDEGRKFLQNYVPSVAESNAYIDKIVAKAADKAHAKAMVVLGWAQYMNHQHQLLAAPHGHGD